MTRARREAGATRWAVPLVVALAFAVVEGVLRPRAPDLAAQVAHGGVFGRVGYVPWWTSWYGGVSAAGYSLTTPPLLHWLTPQWLGALAVVATTVVAVPLLSGSRRPTLAATAVAVLAGFDALQGRTTFAVGSAVAVAALLAATRDRQVLAGLLALLATATSPVDGVLLLPFAVGLWWPQGVGIAVGSLVALGGEALAFGSEGVEPYSRITMLPDLAMCVALVVLPVGARVRRGAAAATALVLGCYLIHSGVGSNVGRLPELTAAAVVLAALPRLRGFVVPATLAALALASWHFRVDLLAARQPATAASFTAPLTAELVTLPGVATHRVEVVDSRTHWPSTYLLPSVTLARGWERQVDEVRNPSLYAPRVSPAAYRAFLDSNAVAYVAEARGVPLDFGSKAEGLLLRTPPPYLSLVWQDAHWRVFAVTAPAPVASGVATATALSDTGVTLTASGSGESVVRLEFSRYLVVDGGTVGRGPDGDVLVSLRGPGVHRLHAVWRWP